MRLSLYEAEEASEKVMEGLERLVKVGCPMRQPGGKEDSILEARALAVCHSERMRGPRWDSPKVGCCANIRCPRLGDADTSCVSTYLANGEMKSRAQGLLVLHEY